MVYAIDMSEPKYDRPNTVSGLQAKHKELLNLREDLREQIKKITVDIDHLDAAIRLFDPEADHNRKRKGYTIKHKAQFGTVKRFILDILRTAPEPLSSRDVTKRWAADRGLNADEATYNALRKRIGACLNTCQKQGLIESCGHTTDGDPFGPYKLWRIKG